ncbi:peptide deformylase [Spongiactinospora sp. TRM90649]|uniref:peptide deformylase n=1 Tax=Spongiactinospora sp. TRM90649 TaxID=3031114 RepID=UPI003211A8AC
MCHGFDVAGAPITVQGTGVLARCFQHETDHLDGMLYVDRLAAAVREAVLREFSERRKASADADRSGTGDSDRAAPARSD